MSRAARRVRQVCGAIFVAALGCGAPAPDPPILCPGSPMSSGVQSNCDQWDAEDDIGPPEFPDATVVDAAMPDAPDVGDAKLDAASDAPSDADGG